MAFFQDLVDAVHERVVERPAVPPAAALDQQVALLAQQAAFAQRGVQSPAAPAVQQRQVVPLNPQAPVIPGAAPQNPADQGMAVALVGKGIAMIKNSVATSLAVAHLIYNNAPDGTVVGAAVGYYASNYIPSFVTSTASSLVSLALWPIPPRLYSGQHAHGLRAPRRHRRSRIGIRSCKDRPDNSGPFS